MEPEHLKSIIESLLFISSKPLKLKELVNFLEQPEYAVKAALDQMVADHKDSGIVVLDNNEEYQLATNSHNSTQVKNFLNAELREKLTDATVEALAIVAYKQPISRAEIETIRGVNSQYSLRNLLMRGLIEKIPNPRDARGFLYQTTTEFLQHLGLVSVKDLPDFEKLVAEIKLPEIPQLQQEPQQENPEAEQPPALPAQETVSIPSQETEAIIIQEAPPAVLEQAPVSTPVIEQAPGQNDEKDEYEEDEDEDDDKED